MINPTVSSEPKLNFEKSYKPISDQIDKDLLNAYQDHITMERSSALQYFSLSLWFLERDLKGFTKLFKAESEEEQNHVTQFAEFIISRGESISLETLNPPKQDWDSIEDIVLSSFNLEVELTTSVQQLLSLSERTSDIRSCSFLEGIIHNQINSENQFSYLLGRVRLVNNNSTALMILDKELM